ncbi:energy transducer TonB [uncultured Paraglaciecola sp.]|uniref:energy transducer TonB n=1 Tax=uncultured Paraglaciecola sp. TaxID=1765024 RepID=UPI002594AA58|nr:energy transducer TonB [uncultured Paraglaciecola sp.]
MKITLFYTTVMILLTGCSTVQTLPNGSTDVTHITHSKEEAEKYWVASNKVAPKYPISAARDKVAGCSRYQIKIDTMGNTIDSVLLESYPSNVFIAPSIAALRKWTWKPTVQNENRTPIIRTVQLDFYIEDAGNYDQAKEHCTV